MYDPELEKRVEKLGEAIPYEGTEVGETWDLLAHIFQMLQESYVSDEFAAAFKKELVEQLEDFENNYEFTEEVIETTRKETIRELIYKGRR